MENADFVVVGSSGGGGTISWLLAKAGFKVVVLEQGTDWGKPLDDDNEKYNPQSHDEYRFRLERPELKRRPRGDYNTFRLSSDQRAEPFGAGWTGAMLGGGSVIWGAWSFRALPIDFRLNSHFKVNGQLEQLEAEGYSIPDWPIDYAEMEPFYNVAETLLAVNGDRQSVNKAVAKSAWFNVFKGQDHFKNAGNWAPTFAFPCPPYPLTPVGHMISEGLDKAGLSPVRLPSGMVAPGSNAYKTRAAIDKALKHWAKRDRPSFWDQSADSIWSDRVRSACNMCGFCGEYLCWGKEGPKSGSRVSTLKELADLPNAEVITDARAFEVIYDERTRRATGVRYLDTTDAENPVVRVQKGRYVVVACGAVQSARLLLMSGPAGGLGNRYGKVGRYVTFHLFGLGVTCVLPEPFQGKLHGEFGHTGNTATFEHYFVSDKPGDEANGKWWKAGTMVSAAKKNPLENAIGILQNKGLIGAALLKQMEVHARTVELRLTGDDLPMESNYVDLDPRYVDEYGFPVARITRNFGEAERRMFRLAKPLMEKVFDPYAKIPGTLVKFAGGVVTLIGDHQMGTCRMGDDPTQSVLDRYCRLHEVANVFVVDSSFMPTGLGLNPMVSVVANALRVGTWIVDQAKKGTDLE
ncbi:MAG TPA: GMC family oxidoreductase [Candidatus Binatia bacterium]|jgi:choline dehydrogenase-like flavoprotein